MVSLLHALVGVTSHAASILDYGAIPGMDATAAFRNALTNRHVIIPAGEWTVRGKLTNAENALLEGQGNPTVLLEDSYPDWFLGNDNEMRGIRISARLVLTNRSKLKDVDVFGAYMGVDARFSTGIQIHNLRFFDIRNSSGWGAGLHFESCTNFTVDGVHGRDSDRGVEIENGSVGGVVQNGFLDNINPLGKAHYSFTLDVHTHPQDASCADIVLRHFILTNCFANISCEGKPDDPAVGVTFENVTIVNPAGAASQHIIRIGGSSGVTLHQVQCAGLPNARPEAAWVFDGATQVSFVECSFESVRERAALVEKGCSSVTFSACSFPTPQAVASAPGTTTVDSQPSGQPQHLRIASSRSAGLLRLEWQAQPSASVRVESSPDLVTWTPVSTNGSPSGLVVTALPWPSTEALGFFRLVP